MGSRFSFVLVLFIAIVDLQGQVPGNLVSNYSFDELDKKIKEEGSIDLAIGWSSPTESKADLFSKDAKSEDVMAPVNIRGREEPENGDTYAGIRLYSFRNSSPRVYLQTELKTPMTKGVTYCVKFNVSLSDLSRYGVNHIGLALSAAPLSANELNNYKVKPQIMHSRNRIFNEQYMWESICRPYIADGTEKFLTIGNFAKSDSIEVEKMQKPRGYYAAQTQDAYYFIEEVIVSPLDSFPKCACEKEVEKDEMTVVYKKHESDDIKTFPEKALEYKTLLFSFRGIVVRENQKGTLEEVLTLLKDNPKVRVLIIGHADKNEEKLMEKANLSLKRAEKVREALVLEGISKTRMDVKGVKNEESKIDPAAKPKTGEDPYKFLEPDRSVTFKVVE